MLGVDLTIPIAILATAVSLVLLVRAWVGWMERRTTARTERLLRDLGLDDRADDAAREERQP